MNSRDHQAKKKKTQSWDECSLKKKNRRRSVDEIGFGYYTIPLQNEEDTEWNDLGLKKRIVLSYGEEELIK